MSQQQHPLPRSAADVWTFEPFTVRSTFIWNAVGTKAALRTESCRFGWHFITDVSTGPSSLDDDSNSHTSSKSLFGHSDSTQQIFGIHEDSDLEELEEEEMNIAPLGNGPKRERPMIAPRRMGRICQPKNIAYKTFKGLLGYLYTQEVTLAPLTSTQNTKKGKGATSDLSSPKSMYRLADMIDLPALKKTCLQAIRSGLTTDNIYTELCSKFTSLYPEVLEAELGFTVDHWAESENQRKTVIARCIAGDYPHSTFAMTSLLARLGPCTVSPPAPSKSTEDPISHNAVASVPPTVEHLPVVVYPAPSAPLASFAVRQKYLIRRSFWHFIVSSGQPS